MIKRLVKNTKGITLASLAIAIVVLMILTSVILANLQNSLRIQKLQKLQSDIDNLRETISAYYMQYGEIPAKGKYSKTSHIDSISNAVDTGDFLVIDLSAINNLTLNYGKDYEQVKNLDNFKNASDLTEDEATEYTDLYIINKDSHNIFYVQGVEIDGDMYYTDYTSKEKDVKGIEFSTPPTTISKAKERDYNFWTTTTLADDNDNTITMPAGFKIAEDSPTNVAEGIVIEDVSTDSTSGSQFVWIPCTVEQYQNAKNAVMTNKWITDNQYKDNASTNGNTTNGQGDGLGWADEYLETDIDNVNKAYKDNTTGDKDKNTVEKTISEITSKWEKNQTKVAEQSIGKYNGFYIARYEAGVPAGTSFSITDDNLSYNVSNRGPTNKAGLDIIKNLSPVSKKGVQAWNYISQPNAKIVSENMYRTSSSVGSYLVDSQAWNHICENIFGKDTQKSITDSNSWGNYPTTSKEKYAGVDGLWALHGMVGSTWILPETYKKGKIDVEPNGTYTSSTGTGSNRIEIGTGVCEEFKNYNIYDMAGNMWEWTTGHHIKSDSQIMYCVLRGR